MRIRSIIAGRLIVILGLSSMVALSVAAQTAAVAVAQSPEAIAAKIDEYLKASERVDQFTGSVLVARDGRPIVSRGYGMANLELGVPNSPETVFRVGSVTKQFTSMAVMILQERGKLSVSDPVCKYFADCPAAWQPLTIRHLLTHTAGLPNYTNLPGFVKTAAIPTTADEVVARFKDLPLEFAPGEKYAYSNSGYYLLGMIIERVSGRSYADFLRESIFAPLGMNHSGYDDPVRIIPNRASGYVMKVDALVNAAPIDMSVAYAAGALYSTVGDMLIWDQALYSEKLVRQKTLEEIFTPVKGGYGYGWNIGKKGERRRIAHGGNIFGFSAYISRFPDDRVTVVVLSNNQGTSGGEVADDLASIVFGESYETPKERKAIQVDPKILEKYVGQYPVTPTAGVTVTLENGKLMCEISSQPKFELFAESETVFFMKAIKGQITFVKGPDGEVTQLILRVGRNDIPAKKAK